MPRLLTPRMPKRTTRLLLIRTPRLTKKLQLPIRMQLKPTKRPLQMTRLLPLKVRRLPLLTKMQLRPMRKLPQMTRLLLRRTLKLPIPKLLTQRT